MMKTSQEIVIELGERMRTLRLLRNLTQAGLAERSGVSLATLRKFEKTGQISLQSLVKLAIPLGAENGFDLLFADVEEQVVTIDELLERSKRRKRGRVR